MCIHGFALAISSSDSLVARSFKSFKTYFKVSLFKGNLVQIQGCTWQDIYPNLKFYTKRSESLESDRKYY